MKKVIILAIAVIGLTTSTIAAGKKLTNTVKNEKVFAIPAKQQKMLGLKTVKLAKTEQGLILVPNSALQQIKGQTVIFLRLDSTKFALRYIKIDEKKDQHSLVAKNVLKGELVVTDGSAKLKTGIVRMQSGAHSGGGSCSDGDGH